MSVLDEIKRQHKEVEELLKRLAEKPEKKDFLKLYDELYSHQHAEEDTVFKNIRKATQPKGELVHSLEAEHDVVEKHLDAMKEIDVKHERFAPMLAVLTEVVTHHVEEEEGFMFKAAEEVYSKKELEQLTQTFLQRKKMNLPDETKKEEK